MKMRNKCIALKNKKINSLHRFINSVLSLIYANNNYLCMLQFMSMRCKFCAQYSKALRDALLYCKALRDACVTLYNSNCV